MFVRFVEKFDTSAGFCKIQLRDTFEVSCNFAACDEGAFLTSFACFRAGVKAMKG